MSSLAFTLLAARIHKFVYYACNSCYELPTLAKSNQWKREVLLPWVLALGTGPLVSAQISHEIASLCGSIDLVLDEVYVDARISEIYDIITEFPESGCAVHELRGALTRTRYHYRIARTVRATLQRRILHPGANTSQIIDVYISTVKVLRILDPTNAILDAATRPVRKYLLRRKDTVRCIVASLTDEASGELFEELHQTDAPPLENYNDSDDEENGNGIFSLPAEQSEVASEVLPMLVSIYGSKDIFVSEYRLMLAKKLLSNSSKDSPERELKYLELLKLRFGEISLHECEVMLRDVGDSTHIHLTGLDAEILKTTVISQVFWPQFPCDSMKLHRRVEKLLAAYASAYNKLKMPRKLDWRPMLGSAEIELDFGGGLKRQFKVSPLHATLILHFQDHNSHTLGDLAARLQLTESSIQKKLMLWINYGILEEIAGCYQLVFNLDNLSPISTYIIDDEDSSPESILAPYNDTEMYSVYIVGILSTVGNLPLARIHEMLKELLGTLKYTLSAKGLLCTLDQLCLENVISKAAGQYMLQK